MGDGIVAYVTLTIKSTASSGSTALANTPSASDPEGNAVVVRGSNGSLDVGEHGNYIVAGTDYTPGNGQWRVEKLDSNGNLIWVYTSNQSDGNDIAQSIAVDIGGNYIIAGIDYTLGPSNSQWRIEKLDPSGNLIGVYTSNPSDGNDIVQSIAVDRGGSYIVVGHDYVPGNYRWRIEKLTETFAYVTSDGGGGTVKVIRISDNTVVTSVGVGTNPRGVAVTPDGAFIYVANESSHDVSVIRTSDWSSIALIPVGTNPRGVAITPDGTFAYVANWSSNSVSVIRVSNNTVVTTIPVEAYPSRVAITPDGTFAYVPTYGTNNVSVIRTSDNTVVTTVRVGTNPGTIAITPDGAFAYVTNWNGSNVSVIRTSDNTVVATVSVGTNPHAVAITPDGAFAYVINGGSNNVSVIRTSDNTVVTTVVVEKPWLIAIGSVPHTPHIDLGAGSGTKGATVQIPITLTNMGGTSISAIGVDIGYDSDVLENPAATIGPAGSAAGKSINTSTPSPGVFRIGIVGFNNTAIGDGIVAYATFAIKSTASSGSTTLANTPSASDPEGNTVVVSGSDGSINIITKAGDCNGDNAVSIAEVQSAINMYLSIKTVASCVDMNVDHVVSIAEVQKVINNYLGI